MDRLGPRRLKAPAAIPAARLIRASRGRVRTGMCALEPQGRRLGVPREAPIDRAAGIAGVSR